jgi:phage baseplate assembly protein W
MAYKSIEITNARTVYNQPPKTSQFYVGFSSVDIANTNSRLYDLELIKQDLINQFNTRKGERLMNPAFGSIIWDVIMEPLTYEIHDLIVQDITTMCGSDPRISLTQLNVTDFTAGFLIELTVQLVGTDQSANMSLTFDQQVGLLVQ